MTTNNEAFEKWFSNKLAECRANNDMDMHRNLSRYVGFYKFGFEAATTEANKRIAELEREVAIARSNENHADDQRIKCIRKYKTQITELQASNNNLREALERLKIGTCSCFTKTDQIKFHRDNCTYKIASEALSATPAESLQAFKNELIEKCAKVCDEQMKDGECPERAAYCAESIRALK